MDNYIVSARKYRPHTFDSVVGQSALTTTLKNAISQNKLAHAYLFCGPRGVGKTTCARIFAKTINCLTPTADGESCGTCESCRAFDEQRSYNIHELDAASNNSVEDIRSLIEQVQIPPQVGRYKVFIIDEVHMLSASAFNAFLKTLEEPPAHAIFILATTEKHKILPTILSRCQIYDFNRMEVGTIVGHLRYVASQEGVEAEDEALNVIAQKADGGMRDALSIFDQVASFAQGKVTYEKVIQNLNVLDYEYYFRLTDALLNTEVPAALLLLNDILSKGFSANHFIGGLAAHFRDLLVSRDASTLPLLDVAESVRQRYAEQAVRCQPQWLYSALRLCNDCDVQYRTSNNKRLLVELTLIEVAQLSAEDVPGSGRRPTKQLKPLFQTVAPQSAAVRSTSAPAAQSVPAATSVAATAPVPSPAATLRPSVAMEPRTASHSLRGRSFISIRPQQATAEERPTGYETTQRPAVTETQLFDQPALRLHWRTFANKLPAKDVALRERMKIYEPELLSCPAARVLVENEAVKQDFAAMMPQMLDYLRVALRNKDVSIRIDVTPPGVHVSPIMPKDRLQAMLNKSEGLRYLQKELKLRLS